MAGEITVETTLRVRYADTDKMGFVYYANYLIYFEVGRTEFIRKLWKPYAEIEKAGYILPVLSTRIEYKSSAFYDDLLTIKTTLDSYSGARIAFRYEIFRDKGTLIAKGYTQHCFTNTEGRLRRIPPDFKAMLLELDTG